MISVCNCTITKSLLGDGCKFCQPREYIKVLEDSIQEQQEYIKELEDKVQGLKNANEFLLKVSEELEDENQRLLTLDESLQDILSGCTEEEFVTFFEMSYDEHRACFEPEDKELLKVIYRKLKGIV